MSIPNNLQNLEIANKTIEVPNFKNQNKSESTTNLLTSFSFCPNCRRDIHTHSKHTLLRISIIIITSINCRHCCYVYLYNVYGSSPHLMVASSTVILSYCATHFLICVNCGPLIYGQPCLRPPCLRLPCLHWYATCSCRDPLTEKKNIQTKK